MKSKYIFWILFLLESASTCLAQTTKPCGEYENIIRDAREACNDGDYQTTLNKLYRALDCEPGKKSEVALEIDKVFDIINGQRQEIERQRQEIINQIENERKARRKADRLTEIAEKAKGDLEVEKKKLEEQGKQLEDALAVARKLSSYLDFTTFDTVKVAWAYNMKKGFGLINEKADTIIAFQFDEVQPFDQNGLALARKGGRYFLVDKMGNFRDTFNYVFPTNTGGYKVNQTGKYTFKDGNFDSLENWPLLSWIDSFQANGYTRILDTWQYRLVDTKGRLNKTISQYSPQLSPADTTGEKKFNPFTYSFDYIFFPFSSSIVAFGQGAKVQPPTDTAFFYRIIFYDTESSHMVYSCDSCAVRDFQYMDCGLNNYKLILKNKGGARSAVLNGLINKDGRVVIEPKYEKITPIDGYATSFCHAQAFLASNKKNHYIIDTSGTKKFTIPKKKGYLLQDGGDVEYLPGQLVVYDKKDRLILLPQKIDISFMDEAASARWLQKEQVTEVQIRNLEGFQKLASGKLERIFSYNPVFRSKSEYVIAGCQPINLENGVIDFTLPKGKKVKSKILLMYEADEEDFPFIIFRDLKQGKMGILDTAGRVLLSPTFDTIDIADAEQQIFSIKEKEKYGLYSFARKKMIHPADSIRGFEHPIRFNGYKIALFKRNNKIGVVNTAGEEVNSGTIIVKPVKWDTSFTFIDGVTYTGRKRSTAPVKVISNNLLAYTEQGLWGIMDATGQVVSKPMFFSIKVDQNTGAVIAIYKGRYGLVKLKNVESEAPFTYDLIQDFSDGVAWVQQYGKWGLIDPEGNTLIPPKYDDIYPYYQGAALVKIYGEWFRINKRGQLIFDVSKN